MVLEFLCGFFAKGSKLVEVRLQIVRHLLGSGVLCVCIDRLNLQPSNRVELLDRHYTQTGQSARVASDWERLVATPDSCWT